MELSTAFTSALRNIAEHGDTDVFPLPFENQLFYDEPEKAKDWLLETHRDLDARLAQNPPQTLQTLAQVGYTGFRWATLIEPFWNAYYLSLVISIADQIENERLVIEKQAVYSYRFSWSDKSASLFADSTWLHYRQRAIELAQESDSYNYVVLTDIADFYPRIYHHRIENALDRLPDPGDVPDRLMSMLTAFSSNVSYGLPIGGPASRILAELALTDVDLHLERRGYKFCRYADDFCIFCKDRATAYRALIFLSEKLHNEGLSLQKSKTRVVSTDEFRQMSSILGPRHNGQPDVTEEQKLLNISIRFDPYSPTAVEDYESLKKSVKEVDVLGILGREVGKTAIDPTVTKQAINAIRALSPGAQVGAIKTLLNEENIEVLAPVFVTLMRALRGLYDELPEYAKEFVDHALLEQYNKESHLLRVELNMSYFVNVIAKRWSAEKEATLVGLFEVTSNRMIRRQIILTMAAWRRHYWVSDIKGQYASFTDWERRAFVIGSYVLGDEGKHWRQHTKQTWNAAEVVVRDWFADRWNIKGTIPS